MTQKCLRHWELRRPASAACGLARGRGTTSEADTRAPGFTRLWNPGEVGRREVHSPVSPVDTSAGDEFVGPCGIAFGIVRWSWVFQEAGCDAGTVDRSLRARWTGRRHRVDLPGPGAGKCAGGGVRPDRREHAASPVETRLPGALRRPHRDAGRRGAPARAGLPRGQHAVQARGPRERPADHRLREDRRQHRLRARRVPHGQLRVGRDLHGHAAGRRGDGRPGVPRLRGEADEAGRGRRAGLPGAARGGAG